MEVAPGLTSEALLGPLNEVERKHAPAQLFVAGDVGILRVGPRVSMVGSRKAPPAALEEARAVAALLARGGCVIVSGLAAGIDTVAHSSTIEAGGKTIAVLGTPLDSVYPAENRELQAELMRNHLVVSQFAPGTPTRPGNFPLRNRTMALLSDATLIIDADEKSGTQHQGWEALRLGRPLFFMRRILARDLNWVRKMMEYGAGVLELEGLDYLREFLPERDNAEPIPLPF